MEDKETEEGSVATSASISSAKQTGLFGSSGIELTDDELCSPATVKFLRHISSSQETEINKLGSYQTQYYDKRQECEVIKKEKEILEKELSSKKNIEILQKVMISVGSIMIGSLKILEGQPWYCIGLLALLGSMLILGGMFPVLRIGGTK
jgi:hypothetical protein